MNEFDLIGLLIDQDLVTAAGREDAHGIPLLGPVARPPATGPDGAREITALEFNPNAVADLGQEREAAHWPGEGREGIAHGDRLRQRRRAPWP